MVHVVDDDDGVREATGALLEASGCRVQLWISGEAFLKGQLSDGAGCILLDVRMPRVSGIEVLEEMQRRAARLSCIIITGHADVQTAVGAMKLGATDFLEKPYETSDLLQAVERAISISMANEPQSRSAEARRLIATLSPRECQVLKALVEGGANKSIAWELGLSPRTVEMHRSRLMGKLRARSMSAALRMAYEAGLG